MIVISHTSATRAVISDEIWLGDYEPPETLYTLDFIFAFAPYVV